MCFSKIKLIDFTQLFSQILLFIFTICRIIEGSRFWKKQFKYFTQNRYFSVQKTKHLFYLQNKIDQFIVTRIVFFFLILQIRYADLGGKSQQSRLGDSGNLRHSRKRERKRSREISETRRVITRSWKFRASKNKSIDMKIDISRALRDLLILRSVKISGYKKSRIKLVQSKLMLKLHTKKNFTVYIELDKY